MCIIAKWKDIKDIIVSTFIHIKKKKNKIKTCLFGLYKIGLATKKNLHKTKNI